MTIRASAAGVIWAATTEAVTAGESTMAIHTPPAPFTTPPPSLPPPRLTSRPSSRDGLDEHGSRPSSRGTSRRAQERAAKGLRNAKEHAQWDVTKSVSVGGTLAHLPAGLSRPHPLRLVGFHP